MTTFTKNDRTESVFSKYSIFFCEIAVTESGFGNP